jgi:hypothetical protein
MSMGWSQIWIQIEALFAHEAMETQVAIGLAVCIVSIMFFEGVWAVFSLPRRALFSLFRHRPRSRFEQAVVAFGGAPALAAYGPRFSSGFVAGSKAKNGPERIPSNRKRTRVNRRRFKPTRPVIAKNTRIEPWLLAEVPPDVSPTMQPDGV